MPYVGNQPSGNFVQVTSQTITGNGGATYTLDRPAGNSAEIEVFVNHVRQDPASYSVTGTSLTLGGNITSSDSCYVVFQSAGVGTVSHPATNNLQAADGTFTGDISGQALTATTGDFSSNVSTTGTVGVGSSTVTGRFGTGVTVRRAVPEVHLKRDDGNGEGGVLLDNASSTQRLFVGTYNANQETHIGTNGTQRIIVDGSGRVMMPNQPSCFVRLIPAVTSGVFTGGSVSHDTGGNYNGSNGRFTAPVAGRYFVSFGFLTNASNNRQEMMLRKNGSNILAANEATGANPHGAVTGACVVSLAVNDYLTLELISGTFYGSHDNNYISVHLLG